MYHSLWSDWDIDVAKAIQMLLYQQMLIKNGLLV